MISPAEPIAKTAVQESSRLEYYKNNIAYFSANTKEGFCELE
jgi:hypothetical protein